MRVHGEGAKKGRCRELLDRLPIRSDIRDSNEAVVASGLDPYRGLVHATRSGRLSLTYDSSEVFKPPAIHTVIQVSRKSNLKTLRGSKLLTPRSIETLVEHLHGRLARESEKLYKRKSIWVLPMREAEKLKSAVLRRTSYEPYVYDPSSGIR